MGKGRPIPENDIRIAVLAKRQSLTLVSRDPHCEELPHLAVLEW